jgi:uncharacterized protein
MIVADTGAIVALIDADDKHHETLVSLYEERPGEWVLPWAILPEVDYLLSTHVGEKAQRAFVADLANGAFAVEWGSQLDMVRARRICEQYRSLKLGLVDATVIAIAERLKVRAIATLDVRDFGPVRIVGSPKLLPRDS